MFTITGIKSLLWIGLQMQPRRQLITPISNLFIIAPVSKSFIIAWLYNTKSTSAYVHNFLLHQPEFFSTFQHYETQQSGDILVKFKTKFSVLEQNTKLLVDIHLLKVNNVNSLQIKKHT